jgi:hypothetical protein
MENKTPSASIGLYRSLSGTLLALGGIALIHSIFLRGRFQSEHGF